MEHRSVPSMRTASIINDHDRSSVSLLSSLSTSTKTTRRTTTTTTTKSVRPTEMRTTIAGVWLIIGNIILLTTFAGHLLVYADSPPLSAELPFDIVHHHDG